jgi:protein-tyrosine phosphatase
MPNILIVCTANVCRSPSAQALLADWLWRHGLSDGWQVSSAGTWAEPGAPASAYARDVLRERGVDLAGHRSRRLDAALIEHSDLILCMTRSHCEALCAEFPAHAGRVHLLSAMAGQSFDIPDPYGGPRRGYVEMVAELQALIEAGGERIVALAMAHDATR